MPHILDISLHWHCTRVGYLTNTAVLTLLQGATLVYHFLLMSSSVSFYGTSYSGTVCDQILFRLAEIFSAGYFYWINDLQINEVNFNSDLILNGWVVGSC
jgi:hypothetical protein